MKTSIHKTRKSRSLARSGVAAIALLGGVVLGNASYAASGHGGGHGDHGNAEEVAVDDAAGPKNAIELGEYKIRSYYPVQARKSIVRFVLYATTEEGHFAETKRLAQSRRHKVRDQVITATRMVPLAHFDEPDLKSFRRRVLLRLRRTLPELTIKDVYISDFELKVQSL